MIDIKKGRRNTWFNQPGQNHTKL